jgi:cytochrome c-type biogenesis protein CcmE
LIPAGGLVVVLVLLLINLSGNLTFFVTPTELLQETSSDDRVRLGGEVVEGSVEQAGTQVLFRVTDGREEVPVVYDGAPEQLFAEGRGVVVEGSWDGSVFSSDTMLVKHDEQYRTEDGKTYDPDDPESVLE